MWLSKTAITFNLIVKQISRLFIVISIVALVALVLFVTTDVVTRKVIVSPMGSSYEGVQFLMVFVFAFGLAYTQRHKGHVVVDLLISKFAGRTRIVIDALTYFISVGLLCVLTWRGFVKGSEVALTGVVSQGDIGILGHIPLAPFYYLAAIAYAALTLELMVDFSASLVKKVKK